MIYTTNDNFGLKIAYIFNISYFICPTMLSNYRTFQDIYQQSDVLKDLHQTYKQIEATDYAGSIYSQRYDNQISIHIESCNSSMLQSGVMPLNEVCLGFMLEQHQPCMINGLHIEPKQVILFSPNANFDTRFNGLTTFMLVSFPSNLFKEELENNHLKTIKNISLESISPLLLTSLYSEFNHDSLDIFSNSILLNEIIFKIKFQLSHIEIMRKNYRNQHDVYCKFKHWLFTNINKKICIKSASYDIGVSRRNLEFCCKAITGLSPQKYIYIVRLNAIRKILKSGSNQKITEIAYDWSFDHLGRFSHDYKNLFGELPSKTIRHV